MVINPSRTSPLLTAPLSLFPLAPCRDLSYTAVSGALPHSLSTLTNLAYLVSLSSLLSFMCMAWCFGVVVHGVARCGMVHHGTSDLTATQVSGPIPSTFSRLTNLDHLDLAYTSLSGELPSTLSALSKLSYLNIHLQGGLVGGFISTLSFPFPSQPLFFTTLTFVSHPTRLHTLELFGFDAMADGHMTALSGLSTLTQLHKLGPGQSGRGAALSTRLPHSAHSPVITALNSPASLNVNSTSFYAAVLFVMPKDLEPLFTASRHLGLF
ncbi:unnamed protein product [Closterium sp. Naga37s-1]|nr:unnamed protein product [Closterium sp. Naga37s-1]